MSRLGRPSIYDPYTSVLVAYLAAILAIPQRAFAWGREGHQIILIPAELYMRLETATRMRELLALLFLGRKVQSEILRGVYPERAERDSSPAGRDQNDSEGLRMTAKDSE